MGLTAAQITELLKELMERVEHPLSHMEPFEVELKDPLPREARTKAAGLTRKATFDIDADLYRHLQDTVPENAILKGILWMEEAPEAPELKTQAEAAPTKEKTGRKPAKPASGPHGKFWEELYLEGIVGRKDFKYLFNIPDGLTGWNEIVRDEFGFDSLTKVSPEELCQWIRNRGIQEDGNAWTELLANIDGIVKKLDPRFADGQFLSPFDMGAKKPTKANPVGSCEAYTEAFAFLEKYRMP